MGWARADETLLRKIEEKGGYQRRRLRFNQWCSQVEVGRGSRLTRVHIAPPPMIRRQVKDHLYTLHSRPGRDRISEIGMDEFNLPLD